MEFPGMSHRRARWVLALILVASAAYPDELTSIAVEADGSLVVVNRTAGSVVRVDPDTGALSTVSSDTVGAGMSLGFPNKIAVESDGSLLVSVRRSSIIDGQERVVRIDPMTGDRATMSGLGVGAGTPLQSPEDLSVAGDGTIYLVEPSADTGHGTFLGPRILRVEPSTGDRAVVSDRDTGTGPSLVSVAGLGVEPSGTLVSTIFSPNAVIRIDPPTGDRTIVSDSPGTGAGPELNPYDVTVGADGTVAALDFGRELFCIPLCPGDVCLGCLMIAPAVIRIDPVSGDRSRISGGGLCVATVGNDVCDSAVGGRGLGPDLINPRDIAPESARAYVVVDESRVMRVNARTGRRTIVAEVPSPAAVGVSPAPGLAERVRRLEAADPRRVYRPRDPRAWLRAALKDAAGLPRVGRPAQFFRNLTPAQAQTVGDRLGWAIWKTMRDVLGAEHPDTVEAARAGAQGN